MKKSPKIKELKKKVADDRARVEKLEARLKQARKALKKVA